MAALMKDDVGIVGARLLYPNSRKLQHAGVIFSINARTPIHYRRGEMDDEHSAKNRYFQVVTAAVLLCHAKDYRKVRMDENFRWAFDDSDFCIQVGTKLGKKIVYCGETEISHDRKCITQNLIQSISSICNITFSTSSIRTRDCGRSISRNISTTQTTISSNEPS